MRRWVVLGIVVVMAALAAMTFETDRRGPGASPVTDAPVAERDAPVPPTVRQRQTTRAATDETPTTTARVVRGTVTKLDDTPIADADVVLFAVDADGRVFAGWSVVDFAKPLASARSGADGAFEVSAGTEAKLVVVGRKDGFAPAAVAAGDEEVRVVLTEGTAHEIDVVDDDNRAIAGAIVRIVHDKLVHDECATDAEGRARLVVDGQGEVFVSAKGFATAREEFHVNDTPENPKRIVLREGRTVGGVVVDGTGKPFTGAIVELAGPDEKSTVRTAADGRFSFDGLPLTSRAGDWRVHAQAEGWALDSAEAMPGDDDIRLVVRRPATVRGVVVYEDGSPAVDSRVALPGASGNVNDEDARFEIADEAPGTWVVTAWAPAPGDPRVTFEGSTTVTAPEGGAVDDVRVTVGPSKTMSFVLARVVDADGRPFESAAVSAWVGDSRVVTAGPTDARGEVVLRLGAAPAGLRVVVATTVDRGQRSLDARAEGVTQSTPPLVPIELRLGPAGRLVLRLVDADGKEIPLASAHIERSDNERNRDPFALSVQEDWYATIRVAGFADRWISFAPPQPAAREETVRLFPACHVVGRVLGAPSDESLGLTITSADGDAPYIANLADDGRFSCDAVPPGYARLDGFDHAVVRTFEIAPGATVDLGDLRPEKPTPLRVAVVDSEGRGLGAAHVEFQDAPDNEILGSTVTRPDGTLDVKLPHRGDLHLVVTRRGFATRIVAVPDGAPQPVRVTLGPAGRVRIVTSAPCSDPGKDHVEARLPGSEWTWRPREAVADDPFAPVDDALYVLDDLPSGPVELSLVSRLRTRTKTVDVVAGKTVDCVLSE